MFKLKCDDFLEYDESTGTYSMPAEQRVRDETERNRWKNIGLTLLKDWRLYLMLVPMLLVYLLWKYAPMYSLTAAFRYGSAVNPDERAWAGISAFQSIFVGFYSASFWMAFRNTFILAFYGLLFGFPMPIILALFFNEVKSNITRSILQVCVYLPKFISTVIVTSLALALFQGTAGGQPIGIVSRFLMMISHSETLMSRVNDGLLLTSEYFRALYVVTDIWEHAGYDRLRQYSILRRGNRRVAHLIRGGADRRRGQDAADALRSSAQHTLHRDYNAHHEDRRPALRRLRKTLPVEPRFDLRQLQRGGSCLYVVKQIVNGVNRCGTQPGLRYRGRDDEQPHRHDSRHRRKHDCPQSFGCIAVLIGG